MYSRLVDAGNLNFGVPELFLDFYLCLLSVQTPKMPGIPYFNRVVADIQVYRPGSLSGDGNIVVPCEFYLRRKLPPHTRCHYGAVCDLWRLCHNIAFVSPGSFLSTGRC